MRSGTIRHTRVKAEEVIGLEEVVSPINEPIPAGLKKVKKIYYDPATKEIVLGVED